MEFSGQPLVLGPVKILTGLLVHINVPLRDGHFPQSDELPILILLTGAHPDITVCIA